MICKNCGAKFDKESLICPYCHSENAEVAKEQKEKILKHYDEEEKRLHREAKIKSEQAPGKIAKFTARTLCLLLVVFVLLTVLGIFGARAFSSMQHKKENRHKENLEEFLLNKDYLGMREYLDKKGLYGYTYEKYSQVKNVYWNYSCFEDDLSYLETYSNAEYENEEILFNWANTALIDAKNAYKRMITYTQDNAILNNENDIKEIYEQCVEKLLLHGFTEKEITDLMEADENAIAEYAEKLASYYIQK